MATDLPIPLSDKWCLLGIFPFTYYLYRFVVVVLRVSLLSLLLFLLLYGAFRRYALSHVGEDALIVVQEAWGFSFNNSTSVYISSLTQ